METSVKFIGLTADATSTNHDILLLVEGGNAFLAQLYVTFLGRCLPNLLTPCLQQTLEQTHYNA